MTLRKRPNREEKDTRKNNDNFMKDTEGEREREEKGESERFNGESEVEKKFESGRGKHKE